MKNEALESLVRYAQGKLLADLAELDDKTEGITCRGLIPAYNQNQYHEAGEVATSPVSGYPYECMTAYDGAAQQNWTIDNRTLWKPWHSRSKEWALPWEQPTGAHDMYKSGEYMIWTDGNTYQCTQDTNFSPDEYSQAWDNVEGE